MEAYEAIRTTRAMRRLVDDPPITDDEITHCLRAAIQAPSGGNVQPWHFVAVTDPAMRIEVASYHRLATNRYLDAMLAGLPPFRTEEDRASFMRGVDLTRHLAERLADLKFVIFCLARYPHQIADDDGPIDIGGLEASIFPAVQNFMVAARDIGIGTTMTTTIRTYQQEVKELLGLEARHDIMTLVPMGRPLGRFGVAPRKPLEKVLSWNRYGNRRG